MSKLQIKVSPKIFRYTYVGEIMQAAGNKGEWFDLCIAEDAQFKAPTVSIPKNGLIQDENQFKVLFNPVRVSLGIAMQLPEGYEAIVAPRSSLFGTTGLILANSLGIIDSSYCGNNDIWKAVFVPTQDCELLTGVRICQFRIQPSQKASPKIKKEWLEYDGIEFIAVDSLDGENRGGFGSTGK